MVEHPARQSPVQDRPRRALRADSRLPGREDRPPAAAGHRLVGWTATGSSSPTATRPTRSMRPAASTRSGWRRTSCPTARRAATGTGSASSPARRAAPERAGDALALGGLQRRPRPRPRQPPASLLVALAHRAQESRARRLHPHLPRKARRRIGRRRRLPSPPTPSWPQPGRPDRRHRHGWWRRRRRRRRIGRRVRRRVLEARVRALRDRAAGAAGRPTTARSSSRRRRSRARCE